MSKQKIELYDSVELKDGRRGAVVEKFSDGGFYVEICDSYGQTVDIVATTVADMMLIDEKAGKEHAA